MDQYYIEKQREQIKLKNELEKKETERFISERTKIETRIDSWGKSLYKVPREALQDITLPPEITLRALVPELYVDSPNQEVVNTQLDFLNELIEKINKISYEYNERALRCLQQCEEIN